MDSQKKQKNGEIVKVSEEYTNILSSLENLSQLYRKCGKLIENRDADKMSVSIAAMRVEHAKMLISHYDYTRNLADSVDQKVQDLVNLSNAATICSSALVMISSVEDAMHQMIGDIAERDIPFTGDSEQEKDENIESGKLSDDDIPLILLYHWEDCGACKQFMPQWDKFQAMQKNNPKLRVKKVEYTANKELCNRAGVTSFPTVKLFHVKNGKRVIEEMTNGRSVEALQAFVNKQHPGAL